MDIFTVIKTGNTKLLQEMLIHDLDVNIADADGHNALMHAVKVNSLPMVQLILRRNPDLSQVNSCGQTVLHICCILGNIKICREITGFCKSPDFEIYDSIGYTCVHYASERGHYKLLSYLLENVMVDWNSVTGARETSLHLAVETGYKKTVSVLLRSGISVDRRGHDENTALILAARHNRCAILKRLLKAGADSSKTNAVGETALYCASENGHIQAVRILLMQTKIQPSTKQHNFGACCMLPTKCPLTIASVKGHASIVRELLHADLLVDFCTASLYAARIGHVGVIKTFVAYRKRLEYSEDSKLASLPITWQRALFPAAIQGHHKVVKLLINTNCDINSIYPLNRTILHDVTREGHLKVVKTLVRRGASMQIKDSAGISPFLESIRSSISCSSVFNYFVKRLNCQDLIFNLRDKDHKNDSGLHLAAVHGNMDVLRVVLQYNQDCNVTNWLNRTPLHVAAKHSRPEAVALLLSHGAMVDTYDKGRNTPLTLLFVAGILGKQYLTDPLPHLEVLSSLLNFSASTDEFSFFNGFVLTPLQAAVKYRMKDALSLLLHHGSDLTQLWHPNFRHHLPFEKVLGSSVENEEWTFFVQKTLCLPFSLQTICRRKIRNCLTGSKQTQVQHLGLPPKLQSYLLLRDCSSLHSTF